MPLSIQIEGAEKVAAAFKKAPRVVATEARKAIMKALLILQASARMFTPRDTSRLASAIRVDMHSSLSGELVADTNYAVFVHEGTRPHWPPYDAIEPWARRHGIPPFPVMLAIARKGTPPRPFFKLALEQKDKEVSDIFQGAIKNIVHLITT